MLSVGYPGGVIRQTSLTPEQAADVRRSLDNYHKLKAALEEICELNQQLLRPKKAKGKDETKARVKTKAKTLANVRKSQ